MLHCALPVCMRLHLVLHAPKEKYSEEGFARLIPSPDAEETPINILAAHLQEARSAHSRAGGAQGGRPE